MVKAQVYLKAGKTKKSEVLDDFCEGAGYCRRHTALLGAPLWVEDSHSDVHGPSAPHPWKTSAGHLLLPTVPGTAPHGELVPSQLEAPAGERAGSPVTKVYDTTQTPYTRMLARKDVAEQTKEHLRVTCAALDMTSLLHDRISWMQLPGGDNLWSSRNVAATRPFLVSSRPDGSRKHSYMS